MASWRRRGRYARPRPDDDRHYAVAPVGDPNEADLPIFVDLDVALEMEEHALSNTDVELGGVLLGGQYHDPQGRPFVLVTDSLRAQHYESTKGSFKFTHDTWQEITRQRDQFGPDVQMVGWYHTHPGWGVFLSGMDLFICEHFFNRPLDVALVIDPCRDERGLFQWSDDQPRRVRQTSGFYLVASRFRESGAGGMQHLIGGENSRVSRPPLAQLFSSRRTDRNYRRYSRLAVDCTFRIARDPTGHPRRFWHGEFSLPPIPPCLAKSCSNWRPRSRRSRPWPTCAAATRTSMPNSKYSMRSSSKVPGGQPDLVNSLVGKDGAT